MIGVENMAAGMDFSPLFSVFDGYSEDNNASDMENENSNNMDNMKQMTSGKPPRHLPAMRHCVSSTRLLAATDLAVDVGVVNKSLSDEKLEYLPVLRSGSCDERGPKQCMEDEHIRIDNLTEHIATTADFPSQELSMGV